MKNTKKPSAKKAARPAEADAFNVKYADISAGCKLVRDELKKNISHLKKLGREAEKLWYYGSRQCYAGEGDSSVIVPVVGIKDLDRKLDDLNWLIAAHDDLQSIVNNLSLFK